MVWQWLGLVKDWGLPFAIFFAVIYMLWRQVIDRQARIEKLYDRQIDMLLKEMDRIKKEIDALRVSREG